MLLKLLKQKNINIFNPPALEWFQRVSYFILLEKLFQKKSLLYFFKFIHDVFGAVLVNGWKTIFDNNFGYR